MCCIISVISNDVPSLMSSFCPECWTDWFDRDKPSGTGDWEVLSALNNAYPEKICINPLQIEVQTTSGISVAATGNVIAA